MKARASEDRPLPALGRPVPAKLPAFTRSTLPNGLELAFAQVRALPLVALRLVVRAGAGADPPPHAGRAHLTASVLDEGTAELGSLEIAAALERLGAQLAVAADWDSTTLALRALSSRFDPALELAGELALRPAFAQAEFERKRRQRLVALLQEQDDAEILAARAFTSHVYGAEHPYGRPAAGDLRSVQALDRDALVRFHADHYRPAGVFLVVVGDVSAARLIPALERVFGAWTSSREVAVEIPAAPAHETAAVRVVDRPGAPQSELCVGHAGPARSTRDYFPLIVLNTILGGSFTSRLNTKLREEKGYTYGVRSFFEFRTGPGPFVVSTAVDTAVTAEAVADIVNELERIRAERVTQQELERARNYLALGLPRRFETVDGIADHIADLMLHRLPDDYYDRYMASVYDVSIDEVRDAAERHLIPSRLAAAVAGDYEAVARALENINFAGVSRVAKEDAAGVDHGTPLA